MFTCKHCIECKYSERSKVYYDIMYRWCTLNECEHRIQGQCCHFEEKEKEDENKNLS